MSYEYPGVFVFRLCEHQCISQNCYESLEFDEVKCSV